MTTTAHVLATGDGLQRIPQPDPPAMLLPLTIDALVACEEGNHHHLELDSDLDDAALRYFATTGSFLVESFCRRLTTPGQPPLAYACWLHVKRLFDSAWVAIQRAGSIQERDLDIVCQETELAQSLSVAMLQAALTDLGIPTRTTAAPSPATPTTAPRHGLPKPRPFSRRLASCLSWHRNLKTRPRPDGLSLLLVSPSDDITGSLPILIQQVPVKAIYLLVDGLHVEQIWPRTKQFSWDLPTGAEVPDLETISEQVQPVLPEAGPHLCRLTADHIRQTLASHARVVAAAWSCGKRFASTFPGAVIYSGTSAETAVRAFLTGAREEGAQSLIAQHGGGYGLFESYNLLFTDLMDGTFLSYGPDVARSLRELAARHDRAVSVKAVGSAALARIVSERQPAPAASSERRVVYRPTGFYGELPHLVHARPDLAELAIRRRILQALIDTGYQDPLILKLHYKGQDVLSAFRHICQDSKVQIDTRPALEVLRPDDIVVIDCPTTTLLQAMAVGCAIIVFADPYLGGDPKSFADLREVCIVENDLNAFAANLPQWLHDLRGKPVPGIAAYRPYLRNYANCWDLDYGACFTQQEGRPA